MFRELTSDEAAQLLRLAVEQSPESVIITDSDGAIAYVNPSFEKLTQFSKSEILGRCFDDIRIAAHDEHPIEATRKTNSSWHGNTTCRRKDNSDFQAEMTLSPIRDGDGTITNYICLLRDNSHEIELEKQVLHSQKLQAIGTLASGLAHDFNNIIYAMIGFAELALESVPEDSDAHGDILEVIRGGERAADLVEQLLTFSRQAETARTRVHVQQVAGEVLKMFRRVVPPDVEIREALEAGAGPVLADATQVYQIVMNLCTNAYQAMDKHGGTIEITVENILMEKDTMSGIDGLQPGSYTRLVVSDTGRGMDQRTKERIFEPYFTTKDRTDGAGLGLSTVYGIVKSHYGAIRVESEPGKGSTFEVYLPQYRKGRGSDDGEKAGRRLGRILFVDSRENMMSLAKASLEREGFRVDAVSSGEEALARFHAEPDSYDLLIAEQTLAGLSGIELVGRIRERKPDMPAILTSGYTQDISQEQLKALGIRCYLKHPIIVRNLIDMVLRELGAVENGKG